MEYREIFFGVRVCESKSEERKRERDKNKQ